MTAFATVKGLPQGTIALVSDQPETALGWKAKLRVTGTPKAKVFTVHDAHQHFSDQDADQPSAVVINDVGEIYHLDPIAPGPIIAVVDGRRNEQAAIHAHDVGADWVIPQSANAEIFALGIQRALDAATARGPVTVRSLERYTQDLEDLPAIDGLGIPRMTFTVSTPQDAAVSIDDVPQAAFQRCLWNRLRSVIPANAIVGQVTDTSFHVALPGQANDDLSELGKAIQAKLALAPLCIAESDAAPKLAAAVQYQWRSEIIEGEQSFNSEPAAPPVPPSAAADVAAPSQYQMGMEDPVEPAPFVAPPEDVAFSEPQAEVEPAQTLPDTVADARATDDPATAADQEPQSAGPNRTDAAAPEGAKPPQTGVTGRRANAPMLGLDPSALSIIKRRAAQTRRT